MTGEGGRFPRSILLLFAAVALAKGLVWTVALPPWYGPDEPQHFDYVQSLAVEGHPPRFAATRPDGLDHPPEVVCSETNVGFRLNGAFYAQPSWLSDPGACTPTGAAAGRRAPYDTDPAAGYSPFYYVLALPLWEAASGGSVEERLQAVRVLSVGLGLLGALATLLAGWHAFGRRTAPAVAAGTMFAFQPMAAQQFAIFNNDALVVALSAVFFWLAFRAWASSAFSARTAALLGLVTGLAFLAKPQGAFLAGPFLVFAVLALRARPWRAWLPPLAAFGGPVLASIVLTRLLDLAFNGSLLSQVSIGGERGSIRVYLSALAVDKFAYLRWLWVTSAWGHFAWLDAVLPTVALVAVAVVVAAGAAGLAVVPRRRPELAAGLVALAASVVLVAMVQLTEVAYFRSHAGYILQGRDFLVALPAGAIAVVAGLTALAPRTAAGLVARVVTGAMLALLTLATGVVVQAFYG